MIEAAGYKKLMWSSGAMLIRDESFTLKSGRQSYAYANHRHLICVPEHLCLLASLVWEAASQAFKAPFALCTVDSSVSPFLVAACSVQAEVPFYNYRAVSREKGLAEELFGYDRVERATHEAGLSAVLVDDVVTTTGTLSTAAQALEENGIGVAGAVCLLDRRVAPVTGASSLSVASVTTLKDMLEYGAEHPELDDVVKRQIDIELLEIAD